MSPTLIMKWTRVDDPAWCLPTPRFYKDIKTLLGLDETYDLLLSREAPKNHRSDVTYRHDCYVVEDREEEMIHPSQKPLSVVEHIVQSVTSKGGTVFDGFAGSGTTALAALRTGRNYVCCEINKDYCDKANRRLNSSLELI
jgi:DNA modification methylase